MEIKTCEQYVLRELENAQKELALVKSALEESNARCDEICKSFQELKDLICKYSSVDEYDGFPYISTDTIYSKWNKDDYDKLVRLVPKVLTKNS